MKTQILGRTFEEEHTWIPSLLGERGPNVLFPLLPPLSSFLCFDYVLFLLETVESALILRKTS